MRRFLSFDVSGIPSSLNYWTRAHWRVRDRERKAWHDRLVPLLLASGCRKGRPMFAGEVRVMLVYNFGKGNKRRRPDLDNLAPKHLIDAMRGYVFKDDGPTYIVELVQSIERHGGKGDFTSVTVEEI